ncbi:MAG: wbgU [Gammaproteobacteria bacterium]|jgi:nucleoside-diphosphate-sugar epimerase|nr:wbgU [Gammaproteobacteria bacterium]
MSAFSTWQDDMKRILITGGAGFIGSHTVDLFLQQGAQVVVLDNLVTGHITQLNLFHPQLRFVQADILDYVVLAKEVALCDVVLHLAALPSVRQSLADPIQSLNVNTLGFLHVLQAIRENNTDIRLVYASSAAVYGANEALPCSDELPLSLAPLSPYALEKANNERYADLYERLFGIKSLGLRYFNVYGSRQVPDSPYSGVVSKFIDRYQKNEPLIIFGDGQQSRDFIHVTDVARANWQAVQSDYRGVLNIATGTAETLVNLVSYIEAAGGNKARVEFTAPRAGEIIKSYACVAKAQNHLQYRYTTGLAEGIHSLLSGSF